MPEEDKIFDVSKPSKVAPSPNSRPIIVGHHPIMADPMFRENSMDKGSTKPNHTPIHVSTDDEDSPNEETLAHPSEPEAPSIGKEDIESALSALVPKKAEEPKEEHEEHEHGHKQMDEQVINPSHKEPEEEEHDEHREAEEHDSDSSALGFTPLHSLIPNDEDDEKPKDDGSSYMDGGDWQDTPPLHIPQGAGPRRRLPKVLGWIVALVLLVIVAGYLAIDLGLVKSDANLPFHIFNKQKKKTVAVINPVPKVQPPPAPTGPVVPDGANVSLDYPTAWGKPAVTTDLGFSKRGGANKSDGTYAYLVNFAVNKDVQIVLTSSKYLPAARGAQYYDFLQWCIGTNDNKFYKEILHFTSAAGIDTPGTVACDQGPITDATKLDDLTIVQLKTKDIDGKTVLGDLYTQNLSKGDYPVLRVKDAKMASSVDIKKLLATVKVSSSSSSAPTNANPQ
jgi:hypothetical protein